LNSEEAREEREGGEATIGGLRWRRRSRGNSREKGNHAKDFCPQKEINELLNSLCNPNKSSGVLR
jgi:hypothetical protein